MVMTRRGVWMSRALFMVTFGLSAFSPELAGAERPSSTKRYIVEFNAAKGSEKILLDHGAKIHLKLGSGVVKKSFAASLSPVKAAALAKNPKVVLIEEDAQRFPLSTQVTPWGVTAIGSIGSVASSGKAMVCIIDSGYAIHHDDLPQAVTTSPNSGTGNPLEDGCGHGTHVAGTIAALNNDRGVVGVEGQGQIALHIVKVFANSCSWTYSSSLVAALSECQAAAAAQNKKLVVNMSLGGSVKSRFEERAFADSAAAGHLSIAAAGNDGSTRKSYPASYPSVVSVAAVDENLKVASFSQRNLEVDIAAPGVQVLSTVPHFSESSLSTSLGSKVYGTELEFSPKSAGINGPIVSGGLCDRSSSSFNGSIVLCERGSVSFSDKVLNAQSGGAIGVVIYNNVSGPFSGTLGSATTGIVIPGITVSREDGLALETEINLGADATLVNLKDPSRGGYEFYDGTSMATPHVAAAAAVLWNALPTATASAVRSALELSATDLGLIGRDDSYGNGFLNLPAAYQRLVSGGGSGGGGSSGGGTKCNPKRGC